MSDDTPTERYDAAGDAPTERITAAEADTADVPSEEVVEERKSRKLMIILGSIGGALLLGVIILLILLLTRGSGEPTGGGTPSPSATRTASATPTPSTTPSATPTPTPTPTQDPAPPPPPPPPPAPVIDYYFVSDDNVDCSSGDPVPLSFSWETTGASVTFGVGTENAESGAYQSGLPGVGGIDIDYQCGQPSGNQIYSIAVFDGGGNIIGRQTIQVHEN